MSDNDTKIKDPDARLDYAWDFTAWLADGETIATKTLTPSANGVTVESSAIVDGAVVAWITGGTVGTNPTVTCQITTSAGRQDDRTMTFVIQQR